MNGQIDILNVGTGHTEIHVDDSNPVELERASRIIQDLLKRGAALFIHPPDNRKQLIRVEEFDPKQKIYIIGAEPIVRPEDMTEQHLPEPLPTVPAPPKRGRPRKGVPMSKAKVTAVGRSAGG